MTYSTNIRHVCTYLNAFSMLMPNKVTKIQNVDIFYKIGYILDMSSAIKLGYSLMPVVNYTTSSPHILGGDPGHLSCL